MELTPEKIETLKQYGDYLNALDEVREINQLGFNKIDKYRWPMFRGNGLIMGRVLFKYRKQLSKVFPEATDVLKSVPAHTIIFPCAGSNQWGDYVSMHVNFLARDDFDKYRLLCKQSGLWFDGEKKVWFVPNKILNSFDFQSFFIKLVDLGFEVSPVGKESALNAQAQVQEPPVVKTSAEAIRLLEQKRLYNSVVVRRLPTGKWEFRFPWDNKILEFFNNNSGILSGITEYNPATHARETFQIELVLEAVEKLGKMYPEIKIISEDVEGAAKELEQKKQLLAKQLPEIRKVLSPSFVMFPHQNECFHFMNKNNGNILLGDDMGLGKTLQSLCWAAVHDKRVLVICPKVVRRTWIQEAQKFFPSIYNQMNCIEITPKVKYVDLSQMKLAVVNYESASKYLKEIEASGMDMLIVDESHKIKDPKTATAKLVSRVAQMFQHKTLLSGTAIKNKKAELFTQLQIVKPGLFNSIEELRATSHGRVWNMMQEVYLARRKIDVMKEMPSKTTEVIELEVDNCPDYDPAVGIALEDVSKLKADVAKAKAQATTSFVRNFLDNSDSSVLVFTDSVEAAKEIANELGDDAVLHHGQMSDDKREALKAGFQDLTISARVFVTTRQSLAVGATLTRADKVVFNDLPWTAADIAQAEARAHRIGQNRIVNVFWIVAQGNHWDVKVTDIIKQKYALAKKLTEGKQLTPEEKKFLESGVEQGLNIRRKK